MPIALLSKEHLAAIGTVAAESAYLDYAIGSAIQTLFKLNEEQYKLIAGDMRLGAKIELFNGLAKLVLVENIGALKILGDLVSDLKTASEKRNRIIHDAWIDRNFRIDNNVWTQIGPSFTSPVAVRFSGKQPGDSFPQFKVEDVAAVAADLAKCLPRFQDFCLDHLHIELSWPSRRP